MKNQVKRYLGIITIVVLINISACDREPIAPPMPTIEQISIADLKDLYKGETIAIDSGIYIQGIVTLTPEKNNIPDFIGYMQDETGGITLTVDGTNNLAEGSEIKILCNGIELSEYNGLLQFGNIDLGTQSELINLIGEPATSVSATMEEILNGEHVAQLVSISNVEFQQKGTFSGGQTITDCTSDLEVYTRADATFSGDALPEGNGTFVGVVSTFNGPQLILRDPVDLDMEGTRCAPFFEGIFEETFAALTDYDPITDLSNWLNPMEAGDREWIARTFDNNAYAQASAYNSTLESMISWLITPAVDLSSATSPIFSFETKTGYHNGATLEVMISTDYDGSASPWNFTWTDLNPSLANGPTDAYSAEWLASGDIDLSSYNSTVYIAFKYTGSDGTTKKTSTWLVDNVKIDESSK